MYLFSQENPDLDHHHPTDKRDQSKDKDGGNKVASNTVSYPLDGSLEREGGERRGEEEVRRGRREERRGEGGEGEVRRGREARRRERGEREKRKEKQGRSRRERWEEGGQC